MVTACVGAGLTGSYIFSQTVFSLRGGVTSRLQGFVIAGGPLLAMQHDAMTNALADLIYHVRSSACTDARNASDKHFGCWASHAWLICQC